jgi:hypothetical protein
MTGVIRAASEIKRAILAYVQDFNAKVLAGSTARGFADAALADFGADATAM